MKNLASLLTDQRLTDLCPPMVKCDKNFFVKSHRKSKLHQAKVVTTSSSQGKQTYGPLDYANFKEEVVFSFLAADIPLHALNHLALKFLFVVISF